MEKTDTSWEKSAKWYGGAVGEKGHFFHQNTIIPGVLRLLEIKKTDWVLDIGCGQGVLGRRIPQETNYVGLDLARGLITEAKRMSKNEKHRFMVADVTKEFPLKEKFSKEAIILALQNIKEPEKTIKYAAERLEKGGKLIIVLNHPCFRIPRQSSWETDIKNKLQYRRINRYLNPLEIPINMHPGDKNSPVTWSFHLPIEAYSEMLFENDLLIEKIEEWSSEKTSVGKMAKTENRAREEFPMFMAILAVKR